MSIGSQLRSAREARGMTLEEVAKLCGTTRQTIYKYENEIVTNIPYDRINQLAIALQVTPSYLFEWAEPTPQADMRELIDLLQGAPEDTLQEIRRYADYLLSSARKDASCTGSASAAPSQAAPKCPPQAR